MRAIGAVALDVEFDPAALQREVAELAGYLAQAFDKCVVIELEYATAVDADHVVVLVIVSRLRVEAGLGRRRTVGAGQIRARPCSLSVR